MTESTFRIITGYKPGTYRVQEFIPALSITLFGFQLTLFPSWWHGHSHIGALSGAELLEFDSVYSAHQYIDELKRERAHKIGQVMKEVP
jgi:hypothetical protein